MRLLFFNEEKQVRVHSTDQISTISIYPKKKKERKEITSDDRLVTLVMTWRENMPIIQQEKTKPNLLYIDIVYKL